MIVAVTDAGGRMLWVEGDPRLRAARRGHALRRGRALVRGRRRHQRPRHGAGRRPRGPDLRQRALPPAGAAVELLGRPGARPGHRRAARRDRRDRRRPRGQPARAHPRPRHGRGGGVRAALAAPRAAAAGSPAAGCRPRCSGWPRGWRCSAASGRGSPLPGGPLELSLRHSELLLLLAEAAVAGEGRTAVQLAAEVHRGRRRGGHRPRGALPAPPAGRCRPRRLPALPAARPRRHRPRPGAPAAGPRLGRLGAGALPGRGPAPRRGAPGVAGPGAGRRRCSARRVLRSRRPELLLRYAQLPEAADDVAVWQACLDWLPASSPRRAAAAAHLLRLRRAPALAALTRPGAAGMRGPGRPALLAAE